VARRGFKDEGGEEAGWWRIEMPQKKKKVVGSRNRIGYARD